MKDNLLRAYSVMATIVGANLIVVMAGFLGKLFSDPGSFWHRHQDTFLIIDQVHGLLFMVLIVLIAKLTIRQRWGWGYMVGRILLACIPLVSFWAERRTTARVRAETASVATSG